jgi:hypothetical protein
VGRAIRLPSPSAFGLRGRATIGRARVAIVEVSFLELYRAQAEFHEVYELMGELGFSFRGCFDQTCDPRTGRPVQADAIFVRGVER